MTASRVDVAALEAALEKATPGPWMNDDWEIHQQLPGAPGVRGEWLAESCRVEGHPLVETSVPDADLIVAAVNAAPALVALVRAVEALHRPIANDGTGAPACPRCLGGINVPEDEIDDPRPCGCWGLLTPICSSCADFHGNKRYPLQWPCPTTAAVGAALNPQETGR